MPFQPNQSMTKCPENCNHRALFKAVGYSDHDLEKPIIGIANSWNEIVPGHFNLRQVAEFVKRGIYAAGGTAVEFGTIACCDGIAQGDGMFAILPTREIIANSVEMMVRAHNLDAIVLLGSCDCPRHDDGGGTVEHPGNFAAGRSDARRRCDGQSSKRFDLHVGSAGNVESGQNDGERDV